VAILGMLLYGCPGRSVRKFRPAADVGIAK